jgi:hypothetical protein
MLHQNDSNMKRTYCKQNIADKITARDLANKKDDRSAAGMKLYAEIN